MAHVLYTSTYYFSSKLGRYAELASQNSQVAQTTLDRMQTEWDALLKSEIANALQPSRLVATLRWRKWKAIRLLYLMAESCEWKLSPELQEFTRDMFKGLPDTKVIEDTHQKLRDLGREARHFVSSRSKRMFACMTSGKLENRHDKVLEPVDRQLIEQSWDQLSKVKIRKLTQTRGLKLKDTKLQMIMHPKTAASMTPDGLFNMAAATEWMFQYWQLDDSVECGLDQGWHSALLIRFDIVRHKPSNKIVLVIAPAEYSFLAWVMECLPECNDNWIMKETIQNLCPET